MKKGRAIVLPDLHVPYQDDKTLKAVEKYMTDNTWDYYILLGDFMDLDCISSHNKNNLRQVEGKRIWEDYRIGNSILDRHQKIIKKKNPKAKFIYIEGNHEYRIERYIDANPQLEGMVEFEIGLNLKERGFKIVRSYTKGDVFKLGKAMFHHGQYITKYHANKMAEAYDGSVFYGHTHDVQQYSRVTFGSDNTTVGQSLGCLCKYEQSYMQKRPSKWQHAFGVFSFEKTGHFTYYVPLIFKHKFTDMNGKVYKG